MMEHGKLVEAIRDTGAFEDVQVVTYGFGARYQGNDPVEVQVLRSHPPQRRLLN